ncbi:MAG: hypothetical protein V5A87_05320 [Candidatus Bipolaricaulota bacterium]|nr:hypothetical protein [Candidatus Bipolaricaulota bacterium]MBS3791420.1 hypothetical protein [Candidatus Bipolaricaulota bacterium]
MNKSKLNFVKGHMGGNQIILTLKEDYPGENYLETALPLLKPPHIQGDQLGILTVQPDGEAEMKVKIVDSSNDDYLEMCGGLAQVLGKAIVEVDLVSKFRPDLDSTPLDITLETDIGPVPLRINHGKGQVQEVFTGMKAFVDRCYEKGVSKIQLDEVPATKVGDFLVVEGNKIEEAFPGVNLENIDDGAVEVLKEIQKDFDRKDFMAKKNADFAIYDLDSNSHAGRLIFPHRVTSGHIEPACGTGTVAVGIAMAERRQLSEDGERELDFESGGSPTAIGGPDLTTIQLVLKKNRIEDIYLRHSLVEILATGQARVKP